MASEQGNQSKCVCGPPTRRRSAGSFGHGAIEFGAYSLGTHCPVVEQLRGTADRGCQLTALAAAFHVRGGRLGAVRGEFSVEQGHNFFGIDLMVGETHGRWPFCIMTCGMASVA